MGYYKAGIIGAHRPLHRVGSTMHIGNTMRIGATTLVGAVGAGKPLLRQGATGQFVMELQTKLGLPVDSIFGPKTAAAVRSFQASHGLSADGAVGPMTWAQLDQTEPPPPVPVVLPENKPMLQQGATGAAVIEAQHRLGVATVDGIFGPQTTAVVKEFQKTHNLAQDGVVGPQTWNAIEGNTPPAPPAPGAVSVMEKPPAPILVTPTGTPVTKPDGTPQVAPPGTPPVVPAIPASVDIATTESTTPAGTSSPADSGGGGGGTGKKPSGGDSGTLVMVGLGVAGALGLTAFVSKRKRHA